MTCFSDLSLSSPILSALTAEGYATPTPIQAQAIPSALAGRDLLGCAQTGTGKTAAFALPILERLHSAGPTSARPGRTPRALVLSPTRELAAQIAESFTTYGRHTKLRTAVVYGGVSQSQQVRALRSGVDILVATPGRGLDLVEQRLVDLNTVGILVLDEADRMLDMGFIEPIRRIAALVPSPRQTLLFSATMPAPITRLADSLLRDPVRVAVAAVASAAPRIAQSVYMIPRVRKQALLQHLLEEHRIARAVVFTRTKHGADRVSDRLNRAGIAADAIHGDKAQRHRQRALEGFRSGRSRVLVATDVAARGLDVDGITHVFNFDLPNEPESYVHRIGRTGRAGAEGIAVSFCDEHERGSLRAIERLTGKRVDLVATPRVRNEPAPGDDALPKAMAGVGERPHEPREPAPNRAAPEPGRGRQRSPFRAWRAEGSRRGRSGGRSAS